MKIGIFDPYLDTLGGGEKYILSLASCLAQENQVDIFWDEPQTVKENLSFLNIDIPRLSFQKNIFKKNSIIHKFKETRKYDVFIYVSDGSIPFLFAKRNILLIQFPVNWVNGKSLLNRIKLNLVSLVICYSDFVKKHLDLNFGVDSEILKPPVNINFPKKDKENTILSVGRFTKGMNTKKQEILIDQFKKHAVKEFKGWKLVLVGSNLPKDKDLVDSLKLKSKGYEIDVLANLGYSELRDHYAKARIYWHAAGFGEDLDLYPQRAEHFGISTVEAMAAGAVPVVFNGGGLKETVSDGADGFLWNTNRELVDKTTELISNPQKLTKMSKEAVLSAQKYSEEEFCKKVKRLIY